MTMLGRYPRTKASVIVATVCAVAMLAGLIAWLNLAEGSPDVAADPITEPVLTDGVYEIPYAATDEVTAGAQAAELPILVVRTAVIATAVPPSPTAEPTATEVPPPEPEKATLAPTVPAPAPQQDAVVEPTVVQAAPTATPLAQAAVPPASTVVAAPTATPFVFPTPVIPPTQVPTAVPSPTPRPTATQPAPTPRPQPTPTPHTRTHGS